MIDAFIDFLLGFQQCDGGILGHVSSDFGCIEEQGTGTLHIHMLVWLQSFLSRSELVSQFPDDIFTKTLFEYLSQS